MIAGRLAFRMCVISRTSTGATWDSMGWVVTPYPSVCALEVSRTMGRPAFLYIGRLTIPAEELNGPTTPKARALTAFPAARRPPAAVAASFTRSSLSRTPSTPPPALIWLMASWAPRAMSMPVDAWGPVIGPSTAIRPSRGDDAVVAVDEQPANAETARIKAVPNPTRSTPAARDTKAVPPFSDHRRNGQRGENSRSWPVGTPDCTPARPGTRGSRWLSSAG